MNVSPSLDYLRQAGELIDRAREYGKADFCEYQSLAKALRTVAISEATKNPIPRAALAEELLKAGALLSADPKHEMLAKRLINLSEFVGLGVNDGDQTHEI